MLKLFKKKSEAEVRELFLQAAIAGDLKTLKKWIKKVKRMQQFQIFEEGLQESVKHNQFAASVYLIENGSPINSKTKDGESPLLLALKNGKGKDSFPNGNSYFGSYKDGKRNGKGIFKLVDGEKYDGEHKNGKFDVTTIENGVNFSFTGTRSQATAWLSGDGFLFHDRNSNGVVDNGTELFGGRVDVVSFAEDEPAGAAWR